MQVFGELQDDGFTLIKNPYSLPYLRDLTSWLDFQLPILADKDYNDPANYFGLKDEQEFGVLYDMWQRFPICRELASSPAICSALEPVLGKDIFLYENSFLFKSAKTQDYVPWHQDFMNRPDEPIKFVAFISLDPLRQGEGALRVIPGSHKHGFYPYRTKRGQAHHTGIPESCYSSLCINDAVYINQDPGDILLFNQLLVHSLDEGSPTSICQCRSFRFSYQGFAQMYSPRLSPISIFGGDPSSIRKHGYSPHIKHLRSKSLVYRALNRLKLGVGLK